MNFIHLKAGKDDGGRRIDRIIRCFLAEKELSGLYHSLRAGLIRVNGKKCSPDLRVSEGDDIAIAECIDSTHTINKSVHNATVSMPLEEQFEILFRNDYLLAINKPYGINVQPSPSSQKGTSLSDIVAAEYKTRKNADSLSFNPGPLHRLDSKTTGVLFFSQNLKGAQWFSEALKNHLITKTYIAILCGKLKEPCSWTDIIEKKEIENEKSFHTVHVLATESKEHVADASGKNAVTAAIPLAYGNYNGREITLARIKIDTGRTHQIRAQSSFHGYPLLGDTAYGGQKIQENLDFYLHAYEVTVPKDNPCGLPQTIRAPVSTNFQKMLTKTLIKWDYQLII
jgi:23S rRNA pseudouridine955/2504/2580 synthase